ncbi:MAG: zf-HC2 domain-containing protein, partial [Candidatus Hydrogenedentes bacterium]|nr:zf-HC2 domain-containing protein [Candidatus Hydrogenedentota bacterium]
MKRYTNCMEVREDFSALLDDELTLEEREQIEGHLSECAECLRELDALKQVDVAYGALSTVKAPEDFEEGVRQAIRPRALWFPALGGARSARWMRPAAVMAALLLVMFGALYVLRPAEPESFQIAKVLEDETQALEAERDVFSPAPAAGAPVAPAEAPDFGVS